MNMPSPQQQQVEQPIKQFPQTGRAVKDVTKRALYRIVLHLQ
jgi:hypothetical protein